MPPKSRLPLEKVTLNLVAGDKETLELFHPAKGWSVGARGYIHDICKQLREMDSQEVLANSELLNVNISLDGLGDAE